MPDRLTDERLEYWRDRWREWENEEAAAICIEALELREEVERLRYAAATLWDLRAPGAVVPLNCINTMSDLEIFK